MTDKEAYELLVKYSGAQSMTKLREMLHIATLESAVENMCIAYSKGGKEVPEDFRNWMYQAFRYVQNQMQQPLN